MRIYEESPSEIAKRSAATRKRRQAEGRYPSQEQKAAFAKAMQSRRLYGDPVLTKEELLALATHPHLTESQRQKYANLAE